MPYLVKNAVISLILTFKFLVIINQWIAHKQFQNFIATPVLSEWHRGMRDDASSVPKPA